MPEFIMNDEDGEFLSIPDIAQGYLEALFFTEHGGSLHDGSFDPENGSQLPDEASWRDIHPETLMHVIDSCVQWRDKHAELLSEAYAESESGKLRAEPDYNERRAGNDLWYTSNGHGVGFWDRGFTRDLGENLSKAAKEMGEAYVGWETVDEESGEGVVYID